MYILEIVLHILKYFILHFIISNYINQMGKIHFLESRRTSD